MAGLVFQVPVARWQRLGPMLLLAAVAMLVLVLAVDALSVAARWALGR